MEKISVSIQFEFFGRIILKDFALRSELEKLEESGMTRYKAYKKIMSEKIVPKMQFYMQSVIDNDYPLFEISKVNNTLSKKPSLNAYDTITFTLSTSHPMLSTEKEMKSLADDVAMKYNDALWDYNDVFNLAIYKGSYTY